MTARTFLAHFLFVFLVFTASPAFAVTLLGHDIGFQEPASVSMERIADFHNWTMVPVITAISVFVLLLLIWVVMRYNRRANPNPSNVSHNVTIEVLWTVVPVLILIVIAVQSLPLLYYVDRTEEPDMTLKVTGYQWYWGFEYPDHGGVSFQSYMIPDDDIDAGKGQLRNLSTDEPVVLPVDKNIQIITTAADVIHSFAVPAMGVKIDSVPGRLNETWVRITKPGVYYGQCSELCGKDHAFMPVEIHAVSEEEFNAWVVSKGGSVTVEEAASDEAQAETQAGEPNDLAEASPSSLEDQ